jgi:hypothetical protein
MSHVNKNITVEAKLISPPTYIYNETAPDAAFPFCRLCPSPPPKNCWPFKEEAKRV